MVCIAIMEEQREHLRKNLAKYKREHPGEWLFLNESLEETFYKTEEEFNKAMKPYENSFGATIFTTRIPFDNKRAEYNLEVKLEVDWTALEKALGIFKTAEIVKNARPYTGKFTVYNNGYLEKGPVTINSLETKVAVVNFTENLGVFRDNKKEPVHAHLESNQKIISYTPKQIKSSY